MAKKKLNVEAGGLSDEQTNAQVEKTNEPTEMTEEQKEYARMTVRKEFNEHFSKWAEMPDETATDDDINAAKELFEKTIEETKTKKYLLSDEERGLATAELLKELNANMFAWSNGRWRGIVKFDLVINEIIENLKKNPGALEVDYSTLIYLYETMKEPFGTGLETAKLMAKYENYDIVNDKPFEDISPVTYSGIKEQIDLNIKWLSNNDKKLNILKEKVNFAYAGIKMNLKITDLEEYLEFYEAINAHAIDNDEDVKNALKD